MLFLDICGLSVSSLLVSRCRIGIGGGEAQEIVLAYEMLRDRIKLVEIQRPREGVNVASEEWRTNAFAS